MSQLIPRIILDTDGGYDDAWALFLLLKAHSLNLVQLVAIICGSGNTHVDNCVINTCRILEVAQQKNISVYIGAPDSLLPPENRIKDNFHGMDGFGDIFSSSDLPDVSPVNNRKHGVNAMAKIIQESPNEITLFTIGALTNVALAIRMYPEIMQKLRKVTMMGGNFLGIGNVTPSAEFNIFYDPEAADIVLRTLKCPITVIPWETCIPPRNPLNWEWRRKILGSEKHPVLDLLNPVEDSIYKNLPLSAKWACADSVATSVLLAPDYVIKESQEVYASVELTGSLTRGQFVLDRKSQKPPNLKIITEIYPEVHKKVLYWVIDKDHQNTSLENYLKTM